MNKTLWIKLIHDYEYPWAGDRNIVVYSVATIVDDEPDFTGGISDQRIDMVIVDSTTRGEIRAACIADAQAHGWLP